MASNGDQGEEESAEEVPASMGDRQRQPAPETAATGGIIAQHENAQKKVCVHGAGESLEQGALAAKGSAWQCRLGSNVAGDADTAEYIAKYNRYQAEYVRRLKAKYFSKKAFNGGNIFYQETNIDDEIIKSSRWPCTKSFAEPVQNLQELSALPSSATDTSTMPSRKHHVKKSS